MPQFEIQFVGRDKHGKQVPGGPGLVIQGPVLDVIVSIPPPAAEALQKAKKQAPNPVAGIALIDTGATKTSIDNRVIETLRLPPIGTTKLGTASGTHEATLHAVQIIFPTMNNFGVVLPQAVSCNLSGTILPGGGQLTVLFGRDLLQHFVMIYNGPLGRVSLIPG